MYKRQDLGIKFYDRDTVDEIIKEVGIPKDIMAKVEEGITIAGKGAEGDVRGSFSKYADLFYYFIYSIPVIKFDSQVFSNLFANLVSFSAIFASDVYKRQGSDRMVQNRSCNELHELRHQT